MRFELRKAAGFRGAGRAGVWVVLGLLAGCAAQSTIRMQTLENAPLAELMESRRIVAGELDSLGDLYRPLCARLGLVQITSRKDWERFRRVAPGLGPCPDLSRGAVIGVVSRAGTPLDGGWPIEILEARIVNGAGYLCAEFRSGTYLADGVACVALAQCRGLSTVLMADVNGLRYFTD